jgi:radical SAM superfamily enzyme YgiQ (UPF0313 family)
MEREQRIRPVKIALINPPHSLEERYGTMKTVGNTMPSLGMLGLAGVLRAGGFELAVIDAPSRNLGYDDTLREALAFHPDAVGMTAFTPSIFNAVKTAERLKAARPGLPIVLGGPHLAAAPEETMRRFGCFDVGGVGEAESYLVPLFAAVTGHGDLAGIKGLLYRRGDEVVSTGRPAALKDMDALPFPAWDLLPDFPNGYRPAAHTYRRLPAATMFTTRGCPEQCTFCDRGVFGNTIRAHTAEYVVDQIEFLITRFGIRDLTIYDDIFPLLKPRLFRICELLQERNLNLTWSCNSRVNLVDASVLKAMKDAGCYQIGYGIESGDQDILNHISKRVRLEQVEEAIRLTDEAGIRAKGFFIIGHPGETLASIRRTIDFAKKLPLADYQTCLFTPFPGTEAHAEAHEAGAFDDDWSRMNLLTPVFVPHGLTADLMVYWAARSYREFYLRPRIIWRYLTGLRRPEHVTQMLRGAAVLVRSTLESWRAKAGLPSLHGIFTRFNQTAMGAKPPTPPAAEPESSLSL